MGDPWANTLYTHRCPVHGQLMEYGRPVDTKMISYTSCIYPWETKGAPYTSTVHHG